MTLSARAARTMLAVAVLACSAVLIAGCGSSASPAASPGTATSGGPESPGAASTAPGSPSASPSATVGATAPAAPPCASSGLRVFVSASQGAAAGSSYYPIEFTNVSGASCTLYGYPGVSFVTGAGGNQIGIPATENPVHPRQLITLAPGQAGHAELQVVDAANYSPADCGMVTARWLRVYPPNQTAPLYASFTAHACTKPRTILAVETVQPGKTGA